MENREILFPSNSTFSIRGKDYANFQIPNSEYKIVSYIDSAGCMGCKLELPRWEGFMHEFNKFFPKTDLILLLYIFPKSRSDVEKLMLYNHFPHPICIDQSDSFNKLNKLENGESYQTFLLDKNNKIIGIGNPIYNLSIKELYFKTIKHFNSTAYEK